MIPDREKARSLVAEGEELNPGPWGRHCAWTAFCAERIASHVGLDPDRAYVSGMLHDIGRRFGKGHLAHVYDGYRYMKELGYEEIARICLTHSFSVPSLDAYIGKLDVSLEKQREIQSLLEELQFDDYDLLIQLCDAMATADGVVPMEERMRDVKHRYGSYPQEKWESNIALKVYFDNKAGTDIYELMK